MPRRKPRMIAVSASAVADVESGALTIPEYGLLLSLPGRHGAGQTEALFEKSGLFGNLRKFSEFGAPDLKHSPFLAFVFDADAKRLDVRIVPNVAGLLELPDDTPVMAQWAGQYRSDWFHFVTGDVRAYIKRAEEDAPR
jgi:hypothetical protein